MSKEPKKVTLDHYVARMEASIKAFKENWIEENAKDPEVWPDEMWLSDWDEQLMMFDDTYDGFKHVSEMTVEEQVEEAMRRG